MLSHLLVPIDVSRGSERALGYAQAIARRTNAKVSLLTVLISYDDPHLPEHARSDKLVLAKRYLEMEAQKLREAGVNVGQTIIMAGEPARCITEYAQTAGIDLIVMATHGIGDTGRYAVGSVTLRVLMTAPCPMFVLPLRD